MKFRKIGMILMAVSLAAGSVTGCSGKTSDQTQVEEQGEDQGESQEVGSESDINEFRPVDCGMQAQDEYEFPFLGMNMTLSKTILEKLDSRELFAFTQEDYTEAGQISYGVIRYSETTEEKRKEEVMSVDILSWEEELEKTEFVMTVMHELDLEAGYSAFVLDRVQGVENVGTFETTDVNGKTYTQEVFQDYDLTLVNVFATWCSPCVNEMPELEALRAEYEKKGIKLGVVGMVMDTKTTEGTDEGAVERAQALIKNGGLNFPLLMPDEGEMNGRLMGVQAYPETFFVDKDGNIVSEAYVGARSQEEWSEIVEQELGK